MWTRPRATALHTRGPDYRFAWFSFDGHRPRGYQAPFYGWWVGDHIIRAWWVKANGVIVGCRMRVSTV